MLAAWPLRAWSLVGMEQLMVLMHLDPPFVHDRLDRINAWNLAVIRQQGEMLKTHVQV